jgi:hypothetical protein
MLARSALRAYSIAKASTASTPPLLTTAEFIHGALYDPSFGYFSTVDVIASQPAPMRFGDILGRAEYRAKLAAVYAEHGTGWLTPCELFAPWYSQAIARYLLKWLSAQRAKTGKPLLPLRVYELGGGTGANARHVLDFLRVNAPGVYKGMSYRVLEISERLHGIQLASLAAHSVAGSVVVDAMSLGGRLSDPSPCIVIGLEVLDNLPHSKAVGLADGAGGVRVLEARVREGVDGVGRRTFGEEYGPVVEGEGGYGVEATLRELGVDAATGAVPGGGSRPSPPPASMWATMAARVGFGGGSALLPPRPEGLVWARYLPTGSRRLLRSLRAALPRHSALIADFTILPPPVISAATGAGDATVTLYAPAAQAPLVASKSRGKTTDHATYLSPHPLGSADIFFPTDFRGLGRLIEAAAQGEGRGGKPGSATPAVLVQSSSAFLSVHGEVARTRTVLGYNPLLEDYNNTAFLTY